MPLEALSIELIASVDPPGGMYRRLQANTRLHERAPGGSDDESRSWDTERLFGRIMRLDMALAALGYQLDRRDRPPLDDDCAVWVTWRKSTPEPTMEQVSAAIAAANPPPIEVSRIRGRRGLLLVRCDVPFTDLMFDFLVSAPGVQFVGTDKTWPAPWNVYRSGTVSIVTMSIGHRPRRVMGAIRAALCTY